ncbi:hypothetical protein [Dyadobacter psychrotolerans]|uniref:Uncharacterized protein n=1 Tax=Dyadobacter psychrotolerans TaxID=2541721 RepID=A0A4R5E1F1_9BACT|nr:hypothetical protein [Dyadobacter psychrotolerans]TDE18511.1 hypothetical protein E0F88_02950 [Dyadobacter psychrotolerans]
MATTQQASNGTLSEIQISLLRLFDQGISDSETLELRKILMDFFDQGLRKELEEVLKIKEYSDEDYRKMLSSDKSFVK